MPTDSPTRSRPPLPDIPAPLRGVIEELQGAGREAAFTGPCVADWLRGDSAAAVEITTTASADQTLEHFRHGVQIRSQTVMVPTDAGPVDVTSVADIAESLAGRDFTQHAMACDPVRSELLDPYDGREHLAKGLLSSVGPPEAALAADPLRALRALRLVACLGFELDARLADAVGGVAERVTRCAPNRLRFELCSLLMGEHATAALRLLRASGIEQQFAKGIGADAAAVVGALPFDLDLRMAGWLRGTSSSNALRQIRYPRSRARQVALLVGLHPVDESSHAGRESNVRRLLKRVGEENLRALITLRNTEIAVAGGKASDRAGIDALVEGIERVRAADELARRRSTLAMDGAEIMKILECPAGPIVGLALRHLAECIERDPACNEPGRLAALLIDWKPPARIAGREATRD